MTSLDLRRRRALQALGAAALAGTVPGAWAQDYPQRPITLVVPFPPGGGFDTIARPFAEKLGKALSQTVIVDNRPGSGGNMGTELVSRAPADGYTLLFANDYLATNPSINPKLRYDPLRDFKPIGLVGTTQVVIAVGPQSPAKSFKELVALSHKAPLTYGTPGIGTSPHLLGEYLSHAAAMKTTHVPYKGAGPSVNDTIGGQIDLVLATAPSVAAHIRSGKLRGIAHFGKERSALMPDVPTLEDAGAPQLDYEVWYGLFAPAGTPESVQARLREATKVAIDDDLRARLAQLGYEMRAGTPAEVTQALKRDLARWQQVVARAGIVAE